MGKKCGNVRLSEEGLDEILRCTLLHPKTRIALYRICCVVYNTSTSLIVMFILYYSIKSPRIYNYALIEVDVAVDVSSKSNGRRSSLSNSDVVLSRTSFGSPLSPPSLSMSPVSTTTNPAINMTTP